MLVTEVNEALPGGSSLLRNEPVQARSSARLTGLLDAAATIIDEIGFERLTTAMVAERAGASIGTVYRYFPDRIAVVEALSVRSSQRLIDRVASAVDSVTVVEWRDAVDVVLDCAVEMYRSEPGFRSIRFGDGGSTERVSGDDAGRPLPRQFVEFLGSRFGVQSTPELAFAVEVATEIGSALVARAFLTDPRGEARFVDECRSLVKTFLGPVVVVTA
ncbi:MAG: hypothetical protein JWP75_43 [Frondihabitans sp.]|nr:hypothetical protein [Frondihabitans sp.]